jgi:hypothetical protein
MRRVVDLQSHHKKMKKKRNDNNKNIYRQDLNNSRVQYSSQEDVSTIQTVISTTVECNQSFLIKFIMANKLCYGTKKLNIRNTCYTSEILEPLSVSNCKVVSDSEVNSRFKN